MNLKHSLRIGVFYDGNFYQTGNDYYRFSHPIQRNFNLQGLSAFVKAQVAALEEVDVKYCQIVENHWFRGRFPTGMMEERYPDDQKRLHQMTCERRQLDIFTRLGMVIHNTPMQINLKTNEPIEKGVDVWLSLEALELAYLKRFDILVLVAGDSDYIPLIRKLNGLGTRVMIVGFDLEYMNAKGYWQTIKTSQNLLMECAYPVILNAIIDDASHRDNPLVQGLFNQH